MTDHEPAEVESYCRHLETYLCRKNDGHLIRIVEPAFDDGSLTHNCTSATSAGVDSNTYWPRPLTKTLALPVVAASSSRPAPPVPHGEMGLSAQVQVTADSRQVLRSRRSSKLEFCGAGGVISTT
jgi:hypothetical protein